MSTSTMQGGYLYYTLFMGNILIPIWNLLWYLTAFKNGYGNYQVSIMITFFWFLIEFEWKTFKQYCRYL